MRGVGGGGTLCLEFKTPQKQAEESKLNAGKRDPHSEGVRGDEAAMLSIHWHLSIPLPCGHFNVGFSLLLPITDLPSGGFCRQLGLRGARCVAWRKEKGISQLVA